MKKPSSMKSMNSSLRGITKLEPSHAVNYVKNMPFKLIGIGKRSDLQLFTGNFQMKDGNAHYLPGGFVFWRGDDEARKIGGWYQVKKFDPITNMPEGPAYRVHSPENPVRIKDASDRDDFEVFNHPPVESGPLLRFLHP